MCSFCLRVDDQRRSKWRAMATNEESRPNASRAHGAVGCTLHIVGFSPHRVGIRCHAINPEALRDHPGADARMKWFFDHVPIPLLRQVVRMTSLVQYELNVGLSRV